MWQALDAAGSGPSAGFIRAKLARAGPGQIGQAWGWVGPGQARPAPWERGGPCGAQENALFQKATDSKSGHFRTARIFEKAWASTTRSEPRAAKQH